MYNSIGANALDQVKVTTLQANLDQLIPGLAAVCLTLLVCKLLKKKVSPIVIILGSLRRRHHRSRLRLHVSTFRLKTENC